MELPIQLKFFRKIELYQEYKTENKKAVLNKSKSWSVEKQILKWILIKHYHLGSPINNDRIKNEILKNEFDDECAHGINNLIEKGYAERLGQGIKITKEGFLMAEVVNDLDGRLFKSFYYQGFFYLVWLTAISGAFIVIINGLKIVYHIVKLLC